MCNANNGENLQLLQFDAGGGPETRQQLGVALVICIQGATYI